MEANEDYVETLLNMGFPNEPQVRYALRVSKNDLNEAITILTSDSPSNYDGFENIDVEMKEVQTRSPQYNSQPPPYEEVVESGYATAKENSQNEGSQGEENPLEFPVPNLIELENRVYTDSWSIPYKKNESLGKCLLAAIRLAEQGLCESDQDCRRFLEKCMPECFHKLMNATAVNRWGHDIHEGVYEMLGMLVDLVATRISYAPVHVDLLYILGLVFNPDTEYHTKNRTRRVERAEREQWEDPLSEAQGLYAISNNSFDWLTNLVNRFAVNKGFECVKKLLASDDLDAPAFAALIMPFGNCAQFLNTEIVRPLFEPGLKAAVLFVQNLKEDDLKQKNVISVCDLLVSIKMLSLVMWPDDDPKLDNLRLAFVLRLLKSPHFNARMNGLKEVTKMLEDCSGNKMPKTAISQGKLTDWLLDNKVLSVTLEGNIDQAQYCDKIKNIVDFLGPQLTSEELTKMWKMQRGQSNLVIDNIHSIIAAAAVRFTTPLLDHFFILVQNTWQNENMRMREKLLKLIGRIGKDTRLSKTTAHVLELLWDLAHLPQLSTGLMEGALDEHLCILNDSYNVKEQLKKQYVVKCVEDIKEGRWVLPALKHLLQITKNIARNSFHKAEKPILQELNKNHDIIKQVTSSLMKFHQMACQCCHDGKLSPDVITDERYTHKDYVTVHLQFLQFILQDGVLYLPWNRARDIWTTLIANQSACDWDRQTAFDWFTKSISDLEQETQSQLFQKEFLKLDPAKISVNGFTCYKAYFENVNVYEHRLKKTGTIYFVEKPELIGLDFLWEVCLNAQDVEISDKGIALLICMSYANLNHRLKRDPDVLHRKFIAECYTRLTGAMSPGGRAVHRLLSDASRILASVGVPEFGCVPCPARSTNMLNMERLLLIAEKYIVTVEEGYTANRCIPPHGACFHGHPLNLFITCENPKTDFNLMVHSNQTVGSLRTRIAKKLNLFADNLQLVVNEQILSKEQKLISQVGIEDHQVVCAKSYSSTLSTSLIDRAAASTKQSSFDQEQEKMLPGVMMASGGQVFDMLYQLADLDESKITSRARSLLKLIPTDLSVQDSLESLGRKPTRQPSLEFASARSSSPKKSSISPAPTPPSTPTLCPKDTLRALFDNTANNMSTFRLFYNLEVLSSKLMPTTHDVTTLKSARTFCDDFLNAGGLQLVVNVLHCDAVPQDVDYETRQGCYSIALQLLRFLLCGEDVSGEAIDISKTRERHSSTNSAGAVLQSSSVGSNSSSLSTCEHTAACRAVQTMGVAEFTDTVACFMRVAWAAAAGKLHLASSSQPIKDSGMISSTYSTGSSRSRQSSTGSTNSSSSENESQCLHPGVCIKQTKVCNKDANIAQESLELLVTCLQLRSPLLASFYSLPFVSDFIVDLLVGSPHNDIRSVALQQFWLFSQTDVTPSETQGHQQTPQYFLLHALLKARLPFWVASSSTRGSSHRLLKQCSQYFDLKCKLLNYLTVDEQKRLGVNVKRMLEDEIGWLQNFAPSNNADIRETDNVLIAGHLKLIRTLMTCHGVNKTHFGRQLIKELLREFLFPASTLMMVESDTTNNGNIAPKCSDTVSRVPAYQLLVELACGCLQNLEEICRELVSMHHQTNTEANNQWEYMPPVDGRSKAGFVGLRNGGATCYMNSVIQQLFMTPGVKDAILATEDENAEEESVFYQLQQIFAHLLDSKLQYYVPEKFWKVFKLWGQTVNIREQQDAVDFYQAVIDQVDEHLKKIGKDSVFKKKFQGVFSDQKICKDCPHRYEREEIFYALNVTVKNATLQDSLAQFVKGELLEGDNAYFCEKCGEKRDTVKRMCIKRLPPVLCIQLKRFGYDWEANRALKFDDHFKFPWALDMEPFTSDGMARREQEEPDSPPNSQPNSQPNSHTEQEDEKAGGPLLVTCVPNTPSKQINYELVGIVVHSGQANAGHYYSFIKDRRGNYMNNPSRGKWYKFNDTDVEAFEMSESALEEECFGGTYKAKVYEQSSSYPEDRLRYWNGYLLLYERVDGIREPISAKKSKMMMARKSLSERTRSVLSIARRNSDSLVELAELVHKGEKKGLFSDAMPPHIQRVVREENLKFLQNRDVYDLDYFRFVRELVSKNITSVTHDRYADLSLESLQLAVNFLFNTYFRTKRKLRTDTSEWTAVIEDIMHRSKPAVMWLVEYLSTQQGRAYMKPLLLECNNKEIRGAFSTILQSTIKSFFHHGGMPLQKCFDELLETLLQLVNRDVADHCKHCTQYFSVLQAYAQMDTKACSHMFGRRAFQRLAFFLLGDANSTHNSDQETATRRWSSLQSRDFGALHETMATLVLNCDVSPYRTEPVGELCVRKPVTCNPQPYLKMNAEMNKYVFGKDCHRYIRETVLALKEVPGPLACVQDMLLTCSFCNHNFSMVVIKNIMLQYTSAPSNELKDLLSALHKLLLMADGLQMKRLQTVIDGYKESEYEGMLAVIKTNHLNDSRRSYQCIKFLVSLAHKCDVAKDLLMQRNTKWLWAVNWLKKKMSETYWSSPGSGLSNESSDSKSFQRTISAQGTLDDATALLTELESSDISDMDTNMQLNAEADKDSDTQPNTEADTQPNTEPDTDADTQPITEADTDADTQPYSQPDSDNATECSEPFTNEQR